jgi:hypothetical protein
MSNEQRAIRAARKAPDDLSKRMAVTTERQKHRVHPTGWRFQFDSPRQRPARLLAAAVVPALLVLAGCGGSASGGGGGGGGTISISPGTVAIDTNCTGCNTTSSSGFAVEQFSATPSGGGAASVTWAVSGGDANAGAGSITSGGQYSPPPYLTANSVQVTVTATSTSGSGSGTATVTITPGFLAPLTPENVALGANGSATIKGYIAEAGGSTGINYAVSNTATGSSGGQGSVGTPSCVRSANAFTYCTVTYTAPATVSSTGSTYVVATIGTSTSRTSTQVLLNTAGISSNPTTHQTPMSTPIVLGTTGGNNIDYDTAVQNGKTYITDCCGGTLGALVQNSGGTQYLLSCNHVLARSDQASTGEMIIQPGLIDNVGGACNPNGNGGSETPVGVLSAWLPLSSSTTNADAAIAQVNSGAVSTSGAIQELGTLQANGTLAAAPPGISSTNGKGENGAINMVVAKSGRTTGLTCASISAISLSVLVGYFKDCGETEPYLTKTYTNQIAISGNQFSDAGDSGSLVVDASNAEPVGLFFAGGVTNTGASEGIANPAPTVLAELGAQTGATYTFVGAPDHQVACLNYSNGTATAAQAITLTDAQSVLAQQALTQARMLVNPSAGILGAAVGKSSDRAGEAAVILYVDQSVNAAVPQLVNGVRTEVIATTAQAVAAGAVPNSAAESSALPSLTLTVLNQAIAAKEQVAQSLMKQNPAFFGVGVGQSFDNPKEAALVIYVDRKQVPATLPATINGLRARYIIMDRLHVTRSYLTGPVRQQGHCMAHPLTRQPDDLDPLGAHRLPGLNLF